MLLSRDWGGKEEVVRRDETILVSHVTHQALISAMTGNQSYQTSLWSRSVDLDPQASRGQWYDAIHQGETIRGK